MIRRYSNKTITTSNIYDLSIRLNNNTRARHLLQSSRLNKLCSHDDNQLKIFEFYVVKLFELFQRILLVCKLDEKNVMH